MADKLDFRMDLPRNSPSCLLTMNPGLQVTCCRALQDCETHQKTFGISCTALILRSGVGECQQVSAQSQRID